MKVITTFTGAYARKEAAAKPPFGAGFNAQIVAITETLEVLGSEISDPGADFCEFRALDAGGHIVGIKKLEGY